VVLLAFVNVGICARLFINELLCQLSAICSRFGWSSKYPKQQI